MRKLWNEMKEKWGPLVFGACFVVAFYLVFSHLGIVWGGFKAVVRVVIPVIVGAGIAYILNPFASFYDRRLFGKIRNRKVSWILSVVLSIILLLVLISLLLYSLIPEIISSATSFANNFDSYLESLQRLLDSINAPDSEIISSIKDLINNEGNLLGRALNLLMNNIGTIIERSSSITAGTTNIVIGFILAIYFLCDKTRVIDWLKKSLRLISKDRYFNNGIKVGHRFNTIFTKYIFCELIDALIVGVANYIFMLIMDMPYSILVSVVVGVTNLVPTFGPIVGAVIGGVIILLVAPMQALWFIVFTIILQAIDGYVIKPKLFGDVLNVPGIVILISIIVFGRIFGIVGIFLAIPLAAIIIFIFREFIEPKMEIKKAKREAAEK